MHDKLEQYRTTELAQEQQLFDAELSVTNMQVSNVSLFKFGIVNQYQLFKIDSIQHCRTAARNLFPNGENHLG